MERQELENLAKTIKVLEDKVDKTQEKLAQTNAQFNKEKKELSENYYEIDKGGDLAKKFTDMSMLEERALSLEHQLNSLKKQKNSPYFARIDFTPSLLGKTQQIYIGLSNIFDDNKLIVADWRAPISSIYYDFPLGKAYYNVDKRKVNGQLTLKRQYKIENKKLFSYFDTDLTIEDEILQDVLSKNTTTKMKQIVTSIQKEQNQIVRTEKFDNILVQGVAGSGKTSIALHRAAYLLYKHRKTLKSSDIIIISPNNIFSSYISEVLPQLGENNLAETTFARIAHVELRKAMQTREEMLDDIATNPKQQLLDEISFKSSYEYLAELLKFLNGPLLETFTPQTLAYTIGINAKEEKIQIIFPAEKTYDLFFNAYKGMEIYERINKIAWQYAMVFTDRRHYNKEQFQGLRDRFKKILYNFLPIRDVDKIFQIFMARMQLSQPKSVQVKYMDKGAMLAIKHFFYGFDHDFSAKYLIIDEMQDFTPVDIYLFKKLWTCPSIYLGDINQCIEKTLTSEYLDITSQYLNAELVELQKTYRSTKEIAQFAHEMINLKNIKYVNRSGEKPVLIQTENTPLMIKEIIETKCKDYDHIAIICKCNKERDELAKKLKNVIKFTVINEPEDYNNRVLLTTCATAKGIEFDVVIVPFASKDNYHNSLEKNLLYVSSTRALHKLFFITETLPSEFIKIL